MGIWAVRRAGSRWRVSDFALPEEVPVALVLNGSTVAVLMATPHDLSDLLQGFTASEGIAPETDEIDIVRHAKGIEARGRISDDRAEALSARRRQSVGPLGCGLCGIDSLEAATREVPPVPPLAPGVAQKAAAALRALDAAQVLRRAFHGMHAAGIYGPEGLIVSREDVGRHNALDKVLGAHGRAPNSRHALVVTSRLSLDLVQKAATMGYSGLFSPASPTAAAVALAQSCGMTLGLVGAGAPVLFSAPQEGAA